MGGVLAPEPFVLWSHRRGASPGRDPSVIVRRENKQQLPPKRVPQRLSSLPGGSCEHHPHYSCRAFSSWAGTELFCLEIIIGGDDYSTFYLFGQLMKGLLELGWVRGSDTEPAKAEFHSFFREQQLIEVNGKRSRVPINSVFAFCNQPGFRSLRNLHKVSIMVL